MIRPALAVLRKALLPLLLLGAAAPLFAESRASLNIDVTIVGSMSVSVDASDSSTHTAVWNTATANQELVSAASATVTNDALGVTSLWALSTNAQSINTTGDPEQWALATTTAPALPGADQFSLQAVFGSSNTAVAGCPGAGDAAWQHGSAQPLTSVPVVYTSTVFAAPSLGAGGGTPLPDLTAPGTDGRMFAGSKRALCWRVIAPASTSTTDAQNIQITVTAVSP